MTSHLVACGITAAVIAGPAIAAPDFPIVDSHVWVMSGGNKVIYWLDDQRILFLGDERVKAPTQAASKPALLQWQVGRETKLIRSGAQMLCLRSGRVMYSVREADGTRAFYQGELGRESKVTARHIDLMNCDATAVRDDRATNRAIRPLLKGHGYLLLGPVFGQQAMENSPVMLLRESATEGISLPFGRRELGAIEYYEFRHAYFVRLAHFDPDQKIATSAWPTGVQRAYWLSPDGSTARVELPSDVGGPQPTAAGFAYRVFGTRTAKDGIYLFADGQRRPLMKGYVTEVATSPDGCHLAFAHAPDEKSNWWGPRNKRTLKVAELCNAGTSKR